MFFFFFEELYLFFQGSLLASEKSTDKNINTKFKLFVKWIDIDDLTEFLSWKFFEGKNFLKCERDTVAYWEPFFWETKGVKERGIYGKSVENYLGKFVTFKSSELQFLVLKIISN